MPDQGRLLGRLLGALGYLSQNNISYSRPVLLLVSAPAYVRFTLKVFVPMLLPMRTADPVLLLK